jgi:hypothetical protein
MQTTMAFYHTISTFSIDYTGNKVTIWGGFRFSLDINSAVFIADTFVNLILKKSVWESSAIEET